MSEDIKNKVREARTLQYKRFGNSKKNSDMNVRDIEEFVDLESGVQQTLNDSVKIGRAHV